MEENEKKRKRELEGTDDRSDLDVPDKEKPKEGLKAAGRNQKRQRIESNIQRSSIEEMKSPKAKELTPKYMEKVQRKEEKKRKQKEKLEAKKLQKEAKYQRRTPSTYQGGIKSKQEDVNTVDDEREIEKLDIGGLVDEKTAQVITQISAEDSTGSSSSDRGSPASATSAIPSASSSSSIVPPKETQMPNSEEPKAALPDETVAEGQKRPSENTEDSKRLKMPNIDPEVLRARLHARIEELRAARKADGLDGKPARNRQELLEARRRKQEQRKAHKRELRQQAKDDEKRATVEAELAQLRGSGSPLTPDIFSSPRQVELPTNFSFGSIEFGDGQHMDSTLSAFVDPHKKKGPQDVRTALEAAEKKRARMNGLDEGKRADIADKDAWLNAKKKAHGGRVKDDVNLLKKTLKRKGKMKQKSEKEWGERLDGVRKGKEMRQHKREENLRKRKEEKGGKGKGKGAGAGKGKAKPGGKAKGRPGFEGSFRARGK